MKNIMQTIIKLLYHIAFTLLFVGCAENAKYSEAFLDKLEREYTSENKPVYSASSYFLKTNQVVEYIIANSDLEGKYYAKSLKQICDYTKLPFKSTSAVEWNKKEFMLKPSVRVICINNTKKLNQFAIDRLLHFVAGGGTLVLPSYNEDKRMGFLYGVKPEANYEIDYSAKGYFFTKNILPNHKNKTFHKELHHDGLAVENFKNSIQVFAHALNDDNYPVIIKNSIGEGNVVFLNSSTYFERDHRGLFFANILFGLEGVAYPIANVSSLFLDDFPASLYESRQEPIASELDISTARFVDKIWWPDMKKVAQKYNIKYTTTITFNYNNNVQPPFLYTQWDELKKDQETGSLSNWITKDIIKDGHELALHGYNHVSLTKTNWTKENINISLNSLKKKWSLNNYGVLPISYIPPTNTVDEFGLKELSYSLPSIKYMCSAYSGNIKNGSGREFNPDPYDNRIFNYPRVCSGFYLSDKKYFNQQSVYLFTGIWTHFVHPDDILQMPGGNKDDDKFEKRNSLSLGWYDADKGNTGMYYRFIDLLDKHKNTYPLSKFYTANEGASITSKWRANSYKHEITENLYKITNINNLENGSKNWFVYVSEANTSNISEYLNKNNLLFSKTELLEGYLFQIQSNKSELKLPLLIKIRNSQDQSILIAYQRFKEASLINKSEVIAHEEVASESLIDKIKRTKKDLFNQEILDSVKWNEYAKLKAWQEKPNEVWQDLESYYNTYEHKSIANYSSYLAKKIWYPNDSLQHLWVTRNMKLNDNDIVLHKEYVSNYDTSDNSIKVISSLEEIALREPTRYNKEKYIKYLLWNESRSIKQQLDKIKPSNQYMGIAKEVAWFYYNKNNFVKAIAWSEYAENMDMAVKLDWLYRSKQIDRLKTTYTAYIKNSPNDDKTKTAMAYIYHSLGEFKKAWVTAVNISDDYEGKKVLKMMLNNDVKHVEGSLQKELLKNNEELFYEKLKDSLLKETRIRNNNSINFFGDMGSDRDNTSFFEKKTTYTIRGSKNFSHLISVSNNSVYQLRNTVVELDNIDRDVLGVQYQLSSPEVFGEIQYWAKAGIEKDIEVDDYFYNGGLGVKLSKENSFMSAQLSAFPVRNGPGYSKKIYRINMAVYYEQQLFKKNASLSVFSEGNYYTDEVYSNANNAKFQYGLLKFSKISLNPFVEGQISFASTDRVNSYPYWVINNRYFGGSGLGLTYGEKYNSRTFFSIDGAYFLDDYTDAFTRFTGSTSLQFLKYFVFKGGFEYYLQSEYYSNRFNFGLKYYLK